MPRSRGSSEMSNQRQSSPRVPLHLKSTAASEANSLHRLSTERSSSPRSRPPPEKKRSTRVATLETKLDQTVEELKKVKGQLAAAEAAKHNIQQELEDAKKQIPVENAAAEAAKHNIQQELEDAKKQIPVERDQHQLEIVENESNQSTEQDTIEPEPPSIEPPATDVFEVVPLAFVVTTEPEEDADKEVAAKEELEMEAAMVEDEVSNLKSKLAEKEKELELSMTENLGLKKQAAEAAEGAAAAKAAAGELSVKLHCMEEELGVRNAETERLRELLATAEGGVAAAEAEMKKVKAQAEQWRKAAEAAAAVLAADGERVERCVSMEKNGSGYGPRWSPVVEEGGGRRKGGIRMFGDLWKKKGQHK